MIPSGYYSPYYNFFLLPPSPLLSIPTTITIPPYFYSSLILFLPNIIPSYYYFSLLLSLPTVLIFLFGVPTQAKPVPGIPTQHNTASQGIY